MKSYNVPVPRRFLVALVCLTTSVGILVGLVLAGSTTPSSALSAPDSRVPSIRASRATHAPDAGVASFADIAERLNPAVVNVDASVRNGYRLRRRPGAPDPDDGTDLFGRPLPRDRESPRWGAGTGFIIDADGYILTNHHVIANADKITVTLLENRSLKATVVGSDESSVLAVLKVEPVNLTSIPFGDSTALRVGDYVIAIGNPFGFTNSVTSGIVSALGRSGLNPTAFEDFIQTDASINPGNSGGALVNLSGELVGINSAIISRTGGNIGIGFAIPVNMARSIMEQLVAYGSVRRGLLGVNLRWDAVGVGLGGRGERGVATIVVPAGESC